MKIILYLLINFHLYLIHNIIMLKRLLFFISITFIMVVNAQQKTLKRAFAALEKENYKLLSYELRKFEGDNGDLFLKIGFYEPDLLIQNTTDLFLFSYLKSQLLFSNSEYKNIDLSFNNFLVAKKERQFLIDVDQNYYNKLCPVYRFCATDFESFENKIESILVHNYMKDSSLVQYESFLQKFPTSKNYTYVSLLRENYLINQAFSNEDINSLLICKRLFPLSSRMSEINLKIENIEIDKALLSKNEQAIQKCIDLYPRSSRLKELESQLENTLIDKAIRSRNFKQLKECFQKFPTNARINEINKHIENIYIDSALLSNNVQLLEECLLNYSLSPRSNEIREKIEYLEIDTAIKLKNINTLNSLLVKYPGSKRIPDINKGIENYYIDDAIISGDVNKLQRCIDIYPNSERIGLLREALLVNKK
jgi:hypothetical protein